MLRIDPIPPLEAGTTVTTSVAYEPGAHGAAALALAVSHGVRITGVSASLATGEALACEVTHHPDGATLVLGPLDVPVRVAVALRADVPSTVERAVLRATAGAQRQRASLAVFGHPTFLRARACRWRPPKRTREIASCCTRRA